tara:strand:- start:606 stop:839 length:234 start_codon:yes stop_codon:yes gene_type:complete
MSIPSSDDYLIENEGDEYLMRVVIDPSLRKFYLYSNEGETKIVDCDTVDEFMNVLELVNAVVPDQYIAYAEPAVSTP